MQVPLRLASPWRPGRLRGDAVLQRLAQPHGVGEVRQTDVVDAGTVRLQPTEVEQPTEHALLQVDLLDGPQLKLLSGPP